MYRTLKNRIIDKMRTKREPTYDENELNQLWTDFAERFYGTERNRYPKYLVNELKTTIMRLKPHYRDIILAIDFEGYSYREISKETGIPEGTLMSRRHRAMSILLKQIRNKHNV
ncbi:MAG: RNA polymerase sigma factor [Croceivirga sp.]